MIYGNIGKGLGMKIQKKVIAIIFVMLCFTVLAGCSLLKNNGPYYSGSLQNGQSITEQFSLTGTPASVVIAGTWGSIKIHIQQMENSGWIAWNGRNYIYTSTDVGKGQILCEACRSFFDAEKKKTVE